jgi:hypothetical protein
VMKTEELLTAHRKYADVVLLIDDSPALSAPIREAFMRELRREERDEGHRILTLRSQTSLQTLVTEPRPNVVANQAGDHPQDGIC